MVVLIALGTLDLLVTPIYTKWWHTAIYILIGLICYFAAWLCYRDARKVAMAIDEYLNSLHRQMGLRLSLLKVMRSEPNKSETETLQNTDCDDQVDEGHPV